MSNAIRNVDMAVREIGTNSIPTLFVMLAATDSPLKKLAYWVNDHTEYEHHVEITWTVAALQNHQAAKAFRALGAQASNAVPELLKRLKRSRDRNSRELIAYALGGIGPPASNAVPFLLHTITNRGDSGVPYYSFRALGEIHSYPDQVVPVIIKCMKDSDVNIRRKSIRNLMDFGAEARAAVPALVESLSDEDEYARKYAADALKAIDPDAAAKAGVK